MFGDGWEWRCHNCASAHYCASGFIVPGERTAVKAMLMYFASEVLAIAGKCRCHPGFMGGYWCSGVPSSGARPDSATAGKWIFPFWDLQILGLGLCTEPRRILINICIFWYFGLITELQRTHYSKLWESAGIVRAGWDSDKDCGWRVRVQHSSFFLSPAQPVFT